VNLGHRGARATVGLPGTGLSYSEMKRWQSREGRHTSQVAWLVAARSRGIDPSVSIVLATVIGDVAFVR
jgi:hypothetical protein